MSAVLYAPVMNPIFKTLDPEFKSSLRELIITLVKEDQEFREIIMGVCDEYNIQSKTPNRLAVIETITGIADFRGTFALNGKEEDPTIPEQLSLLAGRIDNLSEPVEKSPKTVTETRASLLVDHMKRIKPTTEGEVSLSHYGIISFLKHEIQEYRADKVKNIRQVKKEVLDKAVEMYPDRILLNQSKHGRREVRIVLRPSEDRQSLQTIQREGS